MGFFISPRIFFADSSDFQNTCITTTLRVHRKRGTLPRTISSDVVSLDPPDVSSTFEYGTDHGTGTASAYAGCRIPLILDHAARTLHIQTVPGCHIHLGPGVGWGVAGSCAARNWQCQRGSSRCGWDRGAEICGLEVVAPRPIARRVVGLHIPNMRSTAQGGTDN